MDQSKGSDRKQEDIMERIAAIVKKAVDCCRE